MLKAKRTLFLLILFLPLSLIGQVWPDGQLLVSRFPKHVVDTDFVPFVSKDHQVSVSFVGSQFEINGIMYHLIPLERKYFQIESRGQLIGTLDRRKANTLGKRFRLGNWSIYDEKSNMIARVERDCDKRDCQIMFHFSKKLPEPIWGAFLYLQLRRIHTQNHFWDVPGDFYFVETIDCY